MLGTASMIVVDDSRAARAAGAAARRVLPARVVRQVRAVPRGHELDREDARAHRRGRGHADGPRHPRAGPGQHHRQLPVRARRLDGDAGGVDAEALPRGVRAAHGGRRAGAATSRSSRRSARPSWPPCPKREPPEQMARPEQNWITFEIDGKRGARARGRDAGGRRQGGRRRDPLLLLRAEARAAGRRLPHVPGGDRGDPEAADLVLHAGARRHGRGHHLGPREARAERGRRVPAREPPARLPRLRQGRRVPAPGHLVRLGRRALALHRAEAPLQEAARAVAARGDRPRALHPLLPLRALLAGGGGGPPARVPRARRPHLRRARTTGGRTWRRSAATSSSCARWARSPPPPTASARGPGTSRAPGTVCTLCPSQCNVELTVRDDAKVVRVLARDNEEVDDGWLCDKGRFGYQSFGAPRAHHHAADARSAASCARRAGSARWTAAAARARALGCETRSRAWAARPRTRRASWCSTCCARGSARRT